MLIGIQLYRTDVGLKMDANLVILVQPWSVFLRNSGHLYHDNK